MPQQLLGYVLQALMAMLIKLVANPETVESLLLWVAKKGAAMTESKIDDELIEKIEEHLNGQG